MHAARLRLLCSLSLFAVALAVHPTAAYASVIYSYNGANFDSIYDTENVPGTYTTEMSVSGYFELAAPLAPNLPYATDISASIISFSFSDGRITPNYAPPPISTFFVGTDSQGAISAWQVEVVALSNDNTYAVNDILTVFHGNPGDGDFAVRSSCPPDTPGGDCADSAQTYTTGTWSVVPEPTTGLLVSFGLLGLAGWHRTSA